MSELIEVFRSENTLEAQMKAHLLEQCGIHPTLIGENLASMIGMGGHAAPCRLLVPEDQAQQALEVLRDFEAKKNVAATVEPSNCPSCDAVWEPGFSLCWNCQAPLG
jgi:hypothetical protein